MIDTPHDAPAKREDETELRQRAKYLHQKVSSYVRDHKPRENDSATERSELGLMGYAAEWLAEILYPENRV